MAWFAAWVVLECEVGSADPLCDEQLRMVEAPNSEAAYEAALALGSEAEHSYENGEGEIVRWTFKGLSNLEEVLGDSIESGTEICSTLHDGTRAAELVRPKEALDAMWAQRNAQKTASELLAPSRRRYAPR